MREHSISSRISALTKYLRRNRRTRLIQFVKKSRGTRPLLIGTFHYSPLASELFPVLDAMAEQGIKKIGLELAPTATKSAGGGIQYFIVVEEYARRKGMEVIRMDSPKRGKVSERIEKQLDNKNHPIQGAIAFCKTTGILGDAQLTRSILENRLNTPKCAVICGGVHAQNIARILPQFRTFDIGPFPVVPKILSRLYPLAPVKKRVARFTRQKERYRK